MCLDRQSAGCFAAGTLVHTEGGLVPIERIKVGDRVLSQPQEKGVLAYKRVTQAIRFGTKAVIRILHTPCSAIDSAKTDKRPIAEHESHSLIATPYQPFHIADFGNGKLPPEDWHNIPAQSGWQRAGDLQPGTYFELANGQRARIEAIDQIWRTRSEGIGWIELSRNADEGHLIDLRNGEIAEQWGNYVANDFRQEGGFLDRHDHEDLTNEWAYKCAVYALVVEGFHTYYAGGLGAWVGVLNGDFEEY